MFDQEGAPTVESPSEFRLPKNVTPKRYEIRLTPDLKNFTFDGEESVDITVNSPSTEIVLNALSGLPRAGIVTDVEALHFIDRHALFGRGVGYVDAHLLAAAQLTAGTELWTKDKRLHGVAVELGLAMTLAQRHPS